MIDRLKREPVVIIGVVFAAAYAVIASLAGQGVIGQDIADTIGRAINPEGGWLLPIVAALITRFFVTPTAAPVVKEGTEVTVVTPPGEPNKTVTV
jgi:hypothetical protein